MTFKTITTNYTIVSADYVILCNAAGTGAPGVTVTLPAAGSFTGRSFVIKRTNPVVGATSNNKCYVTPLAPGGQTGSLDATDPTATNINSVFTVVSDGTNWWVIGAGP